MPDAHRPLSTPFRRLLLASVAVLLITLAVSRIPAVHDGRLIPVFTFALLQGSLVLLSGAGLLVGLVGYVISTTVGLRNPSRE